MLALSFAPHQPAVARPGAADPGHRHPSGDGVPAPIGIMLNVSTTTTSRCQCSTRRAARSAAARFVVVDTFNMMPMGRFGTPSPGGVATDRIGDRGGNSRLVVSKHQL